MNLFNATSLTFVEIQGIVPVGHGLIFLLAISTMWYFCKERLLWWISCHQFTADALARLLLTICSATEALVSSLKDNILKSLYSQAFSNHSPLHRTMIRWIKISDLPNNQFGFSILFELYFSLQLAHFFFMQHKNPFLPLWVLYPLLSFNSPKRHEVLPTLQMCRIWMCKGNSDVHNHKQCWSLFPK